MPRQTSIVEGLAKKDLRRLVRVDAMVNQAHLDAVDELVTDYNKRAIVANRNGAKPRRAPINRSQVLRVAVARLLEELPKAPQGDELLWRYVWVRRPRRVKAP